MKKYSIEEQALAFDKVLTPEEWVPGVLHRDGKTFLQIKAPDAKEVAFLIKEVKTPCTKDEEGVWTVEYPMDVGFSYVQLLIDNTPVITPCLPISYGYSRPYNYVALKTDENFFEIRDVPHGSVRKEYFFSKVTDTWESCTVYTPYEYETEKEKVYPVLYLQHGHGENEVGWTASGKAHFIMDNLIAEKKAKPFIIVMSNGMTQTKVNGETVVDFQLFEEQLLSDIIPFVESKFRAGKTKDMRAMAGLSMGSMQTSVIGMKHPDMFCALGVFSGFVTDILQGGVLDKIDRGPSDNIHLKILDDSENFAKQFKVFFRAIGEEDPFLPFFKKDDAMLEEKNIKHTRTIYRGSHDWNTWRRCIYDFAQMIFKED